MNDFKVGDRAEPNYVTLSNSLLSHEVANVIYAWRHTQISNYEAMKRIEKFVKEYREDLYA